MRLIVQFESLHRLKIDPDTPTLLILDETESILAQTENPQLRTAGTLNTCFQKFEWLLYNSKQVIAMDAMAGHRTYQLLQITRKRVLMHHNTYRKIGAKDYYYTDFDEWLRTVIESAKKAPIEPFVVVANSKKKAELVARLCRESAPPQTVIKLYTGDSGEREDFKDVNVAWSDVDIIIYTSTISAGCSFEQARFKRLYAYFTSRSTDWQTSIQMMGRIRDISSGEYHICLKYHNAGLPATAEEVRHHLLTTSFMSKFMKNGIAVGGECPQFAARYIDREGQTDFAMKDLYYYIHLNNILHTCQSKNYYASRFLGARIAAGASINDFVEPRGDIEQLITRRKQLVQDIEKERIESIACAAPIEDYIAETLKKAENHTTEQKNQIQKYDLSELYSVPGELIDSQFVERYGAIKARRNWRNLNRVAGHDETIFEHITRWADYNASQKTAEMKNIEVMGKDSELCRCVFALDLLNLCMNEKRRDIKHFHGKFINRLSLEENIKRALSYLNENATTISIMFEIKKNRLKDIEKRSLKTGLELVNTVLNSVFCIKIMNQDKHGKDLYYLKPSDLIHLVRK